MSEGPRSILVVDDSDDIRGFMRAALEHEGYRVTLAENGRQALDVQREQPAEVVITDIFMPDVDGIETIARFKSEFPSVRVLRCRRGAPRGCRTTCASPATSAPTRCSPSPSGSTS